MNKKIKKNLFIFFTFALIFLTFLASADYIISPSDFSVNQSTPFLYNISVNNTYDTNESNVTTVSITLPSSFTFIINSNGTTSQGSNFSYTSNGLTILTWQKDGLVMNNTTEYFWFNATASEPGNYNITVTVINATDSFNFSISVQVNDTIAPNVTLNMPTENYNTSVTTIVFNCSATDNYGLSNITLWGNWNNWSAKNSSNVTGTNNITTFTHNLTANAKYLWSCQACDASGNCNFSNNRTLTIDTQEPEVYLRAPKHNYETTSTTIDFKYNVSDNFGIKNCSLYVDDKRKATDTTVSNGTQQEFSDIELATGTHKWYVECYDYAGNKGKSETWKIIIKSETTDSSAEETETPKNYSIGNLTGTNKTISNLKSGDRVIFILNNESHTLVIKNVTTSSVTLELSSNPIRTALTINETKEFDLTGNNITDLSITLLKISNLKADLLLKAIPQSIEDNFNITKAACTPNWNCSAWSPCVNGLKTRTCADLNNCATQEGKPEETKKCSILEKKLGKVELWKLFLIILACAIIALIGITNMISRIKKKRKLRGY